MSKVSRLVVLLICLAFFRVSAQEAWIYILHRDVGKVTVIDPERRKLKVQIPLSGEVPTGIFPAPSGKYLFVTFKNSAIVSVIDTETMREEATLRIDTGPPGSIVFSPLGERTYITHPGSNEISLFSRKKLELSLQERFQAGDSGTPIVLNRRGTRLYRNYRGGLAIIYGKTKEIIEEIKHPYGPAIWAFAPDFRFLWGTGLEGDAVVIVDESRARIVDVLRTSVKPHVPVFSPDGRHAFFLEKTGTSVIVVETRTRKISESTSLPETVESIAVDETGVLWIIGTETDSVYALDFPSGKVLWRIGLSGPAQAVKFIELKTGEGFACF